MTFSKKIVTLAVAALVAGIGLASTAKAKTVWKGYTYVHTAAMASYQGLDRVAKAIEAATGGELKIVMHVGGSLPVKTSNITQAVGEGILQFGSDGFYLGNVPIAGVMRLPMLMSNDEEFETALKVMAPYIEAAFAKKSIQVLAHYRYPIQVAWSTKKMTSLADLKGEKFRVTSPEQGKFVEAYGGSPVTIPGAEVPPALQRGVVSGLFTASAGGARVWNDMLKSTYRFPLNWFNSVTIANKAEFDKLSPDVQNKLKEIAQREADWVTAKFKVQEAEFTEQYRKNGMLIVPAKESDIKDAEKKMASLWEDWAKGVGPEAIEALAKVRKALGK